MALLSSVRLAVRIATRANLGSTAALFARHEWDQVPVQRVPWPLPPNARRPLARGTGVGGAPARGDFNVATWGAGLFAHNAAVSDDSDSNYLVGVFNRHPHLNADFWLHSDEQAQLNESTPAGDLARAIRDANPARELDMPPILTLAYVNRHPDGGQKWRVSHDSYQDCMGFVTITGAFDGTDDITAWSMQAHFVPRHCGIHLNANTWHTPPIPVSTDGFLGDCDVVFENEQAPAHACVGVNLRREIHQLITLDCDIRMALEQTLGHPLGEQHAHGCGAGFDPARQRAFWNQTCTPVKTEPRKREGGGYNKADAGDDDDDEEAVFVCAPRQVT